MATLDTSLLKNWPTAQSVKDGGDDVATAGKDFHTDLTDTKSDWAKLNDASIYDTPTDTVLFAALDCLDGMGENLENGAKLAGAALEVFSAWLEVNESARSDLLAACEAFNKLPVPPQLPPVTQTPGTPTAAPSGDEPSGTNPEYTDYMLQYDELKLQLDSLKSELDDAVDTCATKLDSITADGTTTDKALNAIVAGSTTTTMVGIQAALVNTYRQSVSSVTRYSVRIAGHDFKIPLFKSKSTDASFKMIDWLTNDDFLTRLKNNFKDPFILKGGDVPENPAPEVKTVSPDGKWGLGKETTTTVENSGKIFKVGGRVLFVAGAAITIGLEAKNRYDEVSTEHPDWSESKKESYAAEAGVVRGGSQIATAAAAGALIGSAVPVAGTAVGLAVGVVVGLAMMIPTGDGKSVGDRVADAGEWVWKKTGLSDAWHSIFG